MKTMTIKNGDEILVFVAIADDGSAHINSFLSSHNTDARSQYNCAMQGISSFLLALATEGLDVGTQEFEKALLSSMDACANELGDD